MVFFYYLFWFLQENIFPFLSDTWSYINFWAPISTKFSFILLPHSIELIKTCWFFTSQSSMKEMKHGNGEEKNNRAIEHLRAEHHYKDIWVIGLSHWNVQNIGMKYLYLKKKDFREKWDFLWCEIYFSRSRVLYAPKTFENLFYPTFFCCKHIERKTSFLNMS